MKIFILKSLAFFYDYFYYSAEAGVRGSGFGLAFTGVYHAFPERGAVFLYRNPRTVPCQDLYGGQETPDLSGEGGAIKFLNTFLAGKSIHNLDYI